MGVDADQLSVARVLVEEAPRVFAALENGVVHVVEIKVVRCLHTCGSSPNDDKLVVGLQCTRNHRRRDYVAKGNEKYYWLHHFGFDSLVNFDHNIVRTCSENRRILNASNPNDGVAMQSRVT
jgi:hypothetical protein